MNSLNNPLNLTPDQITALNTEYQTRIATRNENEARIKEIHAIFESMGEGRYPGVVADLTVKYCDGRRTPNVEKLIEKLGKSVYERFYTKVSKGFYKINIVNKTVEQKKS